MKLVIRVIKPLVESGKLKMTLLMVLNLEYLFDTELTQYAPLLLICGAYWVKMLLGGKKVCYIIIVK